MYKKMIENHGHPMSGKIHSDETKNKISKKAKGRVRSEKSKKRQSKSIKELFSTPEIKEKLSKSNRGENNSSCKLNKEKVIWLRENQGNYHIPTMAKELGVSRVAIYSILKRKTWSHI